jgi:holo-[acyl-carrier protein] synthase
MAIFGIGVDIVEISRFTMTNSQALAKRILTANEYSEFLLSSKKEVYLAKKFASKEAIAKSLGTGIGESLSFQNIEISHNAIGKPIVVIFSEILEQITTSPTTQVFISIADTSHLVTAYAIAQI